MTNNVLSKALVLLPDYMYVLVLVLLSNFTFAQSDISGKVWLDLDADGILEMGETGQVGIPVFLITCSGQFIQSSVTDNNGDYSFPGVTDGNYKLFFNTSILGGPYVFSFYDNVTDNRAQANGYTVCTVTNDDTYVIHAGLTVLSDIGNLVWEDVDGNGIQNIGEPGIFNMPVQLIRYIDGVTIAQTTTAFNGSYLFHHIFPGQYYIKFLPDTKFSATINDNSNNLLNSDVTGSNGPMTTDTFSVIAGLDNHDIDGGFFECAKICGTIYYDDNFSDSLNTNENGINGLHVKLWQITATDTIVYHQVVTATKPGSPSDDGYYSFCAPPGTYFIEVALNSITDLVAGLPFVTNDPATYNSITHENGTNTTGTINVESGSTVCNINSGFYCTGSITTRVWFDNNFNGVLDFSDYGMANTEVFLYDENYNEIAIGLTDAAGYIVFDSLKNGNYFINSIIAPGMSYTIPNMGDEEHDSDIDGTMGVGTSAIIVLDSCQHFNNVDAGIGFGVLPVVWGDISANKIKNIHRIQWDIINEYNVSHYVVTKKYNESKLWEDLGVIEAKRTSKAVSYAFDYAEPQVTSEVYYRIKAVDFDGKYILSEIVQIKPEDNSNFNFAVAPNPVTDLIEIDLLSLPKTPENFMISMVNNLGVKVLDIPAELNGKQMISVAHIPDGIYFISLKSSNKTINSRKVIIAR